MRIKLWGVRGSVPTPITGEAIEKKIRQVLQLAKPGDVSSDEAVEAFLHSLPFSLKNTYGGNTACIEVSTDSGDLIILDCGSGVINLGRSLMKGPFGQGRGAADIFISHTHWDHISGIPFFGPIYVPGNRFTFYSPLPDLKERLSYQQAATHFPITFDSLAASKDFVCIKEDEEFFLNNSRIFAKLMPHPGKSYAYRIENNGKSCVYTSDCEFNLAEIDDVDSYYDLFHDADVIIFDAQYTQEEALNKPDWGHSSGYMALDITAKFKAKQLILFHHEPGYDDEKLDNILSNTLSYQTMHKAEVKRVKVDIAREGMEIII